MAAQLSRGGEGQLLNDDELLWQLVVGDFILEVRDHLGERDALSGLRDDAQAIALAEALVGDADHGRVHDLWMRVEHLLDLAREELLATAVDDLLASADDLDLARRIDDAPEAA